MLDFLTLFDHPQQPEVDVDYFDGHMHDLVSLPLEREKEQLMMQYYSRDLELITRGMDLTTAAGYPYEFMGFSKKAQAIPLCKQFVYRYLNNFNKYRRESYWFTATRAKLMERYKPDTARVLEYPPMHTVMMGAIWSKPSNMHLIENRFRNNSAVGISWYHYGADDFFKFIYKHFYDYTPTWTKMEKEKLNDLVFHSSDVSKWDTSVLSQCLWKCTNYHKGLAHKMKVYDLDALIDTMYDDMINAKLILPPNNRVL